MSKSSNPPLSAHDLPVEGPAGIATHADLVAALDQLRRRAPDGQMRRPMTLKQISTATAIPLSTVHSYLSGRSIPPVEALAALVHVFGVDTAGRMAWLNALDRVETASRRRSLPEPAPRTVSPPIRDFVGRAHTLGLMTEQWQRAEGRSPLLVLTGPGGIGKTGIALEWAHRHTDQFPDGSLQVDMDGFGVREPMSAPRAQRLLLTALGLSPTRMPTEVTELAMFFHSEISKRRLLILLDNARDAAAVETMLSSGPGVTTLVTSRDTMRPLSVAHGIQPIRVPLMDTDEAKALLRRASGGATSELLEQTAVECGGLPLALRLSADSLSMPSGPYGQPPHLKLMVAGIDRGVWGAIESSLAVLDPAGRNAFIALGALPGRVFTVATATVVLGDDVSESLDALAGVHLIEPNNVGWARHGLVDEVAWEMADMDPSTAARRETLLRHYAWVSRTLCPDHESPVPFNVDVGPVGPMADIDAAHVRDVELGSMLRLCDWAVDTGRSDLAALVLDRLAVDLESRGEGEEIQRLAHRLADDERASLGAKWVGLRSMVRWAQSCGDASQEVAISRRAVMILEGQDGFAPQWRHALSNLGSALTVTAERDEGVRILREVIAACRDADDLDLQGIAENALAGDMGNRGELDEAVELFAHAARTRLMGGHPAGAITPLSNGIRIALRSYEHRGDQSYLDKAIALSQQLEELPEQGTLTDQVQKALAQTSILLAEHRVRPAFDLIDHARELAEQSHDRWNMREVETMATLAYLADGRVAEALDRAEVVLAQSRSMGDEVYEASVLMFMAEELVRTGHPEQARERLDAADELIAQHGLERVYERERAAILAALEQTPADDAPS